MDLLEPVPPGKPSFINAPICSELTALEADFAILGIPNGYPYTMDAMTSPSASAPAAIREQSTRYGKFLDHYDFDIGSPLFAGGTMRIVDCGDVAMTPGQFAENTRRSTEAVSAILDRNAIPIVLGGDHAIPIPVMRSFAGRGDMVVVQLDAHLDWRHERFGVTEGLSSPMRRASELPFVTGMAQIGMRGLGSARQQEVDDAVAYGSVIITARELHQIGVEAVLDRIPASERYYITFDADGLDPAIAPGVNDPGFGGITYYEATDLLEGIARKGQIVGFDFVEIVPSADVANMTSLLAARLILNLIGSVSRRASQS